MRRAVFAPKEYKNPDNIEKFRGIYMPYWVYSYEKKGAIRVPASKTKRRGDYVYTSYYDLDCELEESYSGLSYDASASFADNLSEGIAPFDLQKSKEFTPSFLSGFYADTSDVEATVYKYDIENMVIEDGSRRLSSSSGFGRYSITNYSLKNAVRPTKKTTKLAMLPVWFLSYRNGDKVSYAVVNGQTGKVAAEIPMDPVKYAIGSAILTIPFFFLLNLFFTLKPAAVLGVAIVLAILSIVISNRQLSDLKLKETREDDKGLASKSQSSSISGVIAKSIGKVILVLLAIQLGLPVFMRLLLNIGGSDMAPVYAFALVMIFMVFASRMISMKKSLLRGEEIEKRPKVPLKEKMHTIWKPIAGIAMAFIILLVNPVNDWFYYIGVILCLAMVMWAFMDIIKHHNELTMRKLPQFNKRGGDENA